MKALNLPKEKFFIGPALIWKRIAAFIIDIIIINLTILYPFRVLFQKILPKNYSFLEAYQFLINSANFTTYLNSISFIMSIFIILYFLMMERKMGQTIGKMVMKIYVINDNAALKSWQFLVRNIVFVPVFPFFLLWAIDPLFMFFTKTNQRLTEILSKTRVVEKYNLG